MRIARASLFLPVLIVALGVSAGPALATERFCVIWDGFAGGPFPGKGCPVDSTVGLEYHHLVARELDQGVPGPTRHYQIIFTKPLDKATTFLWEKLDTGTTIQEVELRFLSGPPLQQGDYIITLTNVRVLGIEPIVAHSDDTANDFLGSQERVRINYESMWIQDMQNQTEYTITP